jgi:hypothetical protein
MVLAAVITFIEVTTSGMKAREQTSVVTLQAEIVEPQLGRNIERRFVLTGFNWANVQAVQYVCAHGVQLRYSCQWCRRLLAETKSRQGRIKR